MKTPLILNLAWAGVAGAAFYAGWSMRQQPEAGAPVTKSGAAVASNTIGPAGGKGINPVLVSKDSTVLEFYRQFGLDSGKPLTPEKMKEAMLMAIRETDPVKSQLMFARLMEELTPENAPTILATIRENVGGFESMRFTGMLAYKWGEADPLKAMEELGKGGGRDAGMSKNFALTGWAAKDPDGALKWLESYEGEDKGWMSMSLVNGLARADIDKATSYAMSIKDEGEKSRAAESIAREMVRSGGTEKATAWLASLTDGDMKKGAFQTVAEQIMRSDPAKAAEFVKAHANEDYASRSIGDVAQNLARKDVKQALDFANGLTGKAQARATGETVKEWMRSNEGAQSEAASTYVTTLPAGDTRDAGAAAVAREIVRDDPASALQWVGSIANAESRTDATIDVARQWMREDRDAATQWLSTSGLTEEQQQQVAQPGRPDWGGGGFPGGFNRGGGRGPGGGGRGR